MILDQITLQNFRSYLKTTIRFSPRITLIVGPNTAGKTNILEAIYLLATGRSFRADADREVIRWETELSIIKGIVTSGSEQTTLELKVTSGEVQGKKTALKKYLINGVARRQLDFVGVARAVLFWPEDLELVTDSPSLRRRYLDSVLMQVDREYRRVLVSYERALRQRNKLLDFINEGTASRSQLLFWNQILIRAGGYITEKRAAYLDFINQTAMKDSTYRIEYDKSVISEARLEQYKDEEVAAKATLVGPHRDDFIVQKEKRKGKGFLDLSKYGSRGEQRLAILWIKLAELSYIETVTGERPLLLLDDIFSELDEEHRDLVWDLVDKQQTILASAEKDIVPKSRRKQVTIIQL